MLSPMRRACFASTMVEQVVTTLDDHDRLIAYVLGLSHAINIAFFTALAESGEAAPRLARLSSTTFDAQLAVASLVAGESPAFTSRSRRSTSTVATRSRPWSRP
jgi:chorismate mutase/prephenate dehydrogenase